MIVDDEANFREIFSRKLESAGYTVVIAQSGFECLEKLQSEKIRPDLILMDVQMPDMSGVATLMKIKEIPGLSGIKVLFLTNLGEPTLELQGADRAYAKEFGAIGYLKKTDDLNMLLEHIGIYIASPG